MMMLRNATFLFLFFIGINGFAQNSNKFIVVLDAGHGGKDYGAVYHGNIEKNIALKTALKIGDILEKDNQIQIVYTRKTDVFIELQQRANIANKAKANIFVSIHCNANTNTSAFGNETFVMGITRNAANLEVAKMENEVVTLEKDYKVKYDGYDPKSPESIIGFNILQEEYLEQSIDLAGKIQERFQQNLSSKDRGVKQAGFLVLRQITMPRVLVEMGFISNKEEGAILNSNEGQDKVAEAIARAILDYKKEYFTETNSSDKNVTINDDENRKPIKEEVKNTNSNTTSTTKTNNNEVVFKIQISASSKDISTNPSNFNGLDNISKEKTKNLYRYYYSEVSSYETAKEKLNEAKLKGYSSAFIVAFKNGRKIDLNSALK